MSPARPYPGPGRPEAPHSSSSVQSPGRGEASDQPLYIPSLPTLYCSVVREWCREYSLDGSGDPWEETSQQISCRGTPTSLTVVTSTVMAAKREGVRYALKLFQTFVDIYLYPLSFFYMLFITSYSVFSHAIDT